MLRRLTLAVLALLAATWGWSAFALLMSNDNADASIEVTPKEIVIHHAPSARPTPTRLTLKNTGNQSVRILAVESTCGCTLPDFSEPVEIAGGEEHVLEVSGTPPGIGEKQAALTVRIDSQAQPALRVPVLLKGKPLEVPYVSSLPERLELRTTRLEPLSHEFTVRIVESPNAKPWLGTPTADAADCEIDRLDMTEEPGPAGSVLRSYRFRLNAPAPPSDGTPQHRQVRFATSRPAQTEPRPMRVTYRFVPAVRAVPEEIFVRLSDSRETVERTILFQAEDASQEITITSEESTVNWLEAGQIESLSGESALIGRMTIRVDPDRLPMGTVDATLLFRTDHADCQAVPVRVHVLRPSANPS